MSDSESETARVPRDNPLFSGEGSSAPQDFGCSAVPIYICPKCKFANALTAELGICFACAMLEVLANRDEEDSDA